MSRPRIIHVYKDVFPPVQGGIERIIGLLARFSEPHFDVGVLVASPTMKARRRTIHNNVEVHEIASFGRAFSAPLAPGFISALRRCRADLFHFHVPHPTGEVAFLLSGLKTPAVATYHSDVIRQAWAMNVYGPLFHKFLSRMSVIMPTSRRYMETSPWLAQHRERCVVVPLGYPLEEYDETPAIARRIGDLRNQYGEFVLFLGCLRAYKGLHNLLMAIGLLPRARLLIAGDGAQRGELEAAARTMNLGDCVTFLGNVDHHDAVALLRAAAVLVLPSHQRSEAFGLVQIEAMACGTPVISTDLPTGVPEVNAHGISGLVVPPQEPHALAHAIEQLLGNPDQRRQMGEAGRRRAQSLYRAETMAEHVMGIYGTVLGATKLA